jgi:glycosyltransferase involved in cell wall biosynthesis
MKSERPLITVLMPVYNGEKYIGKAIQSVLDQTEQRFELLIISDGSTDQSSAIIKSYRDQRIRLIEQERKGISYALNTGLQNAGGQLIARFDADDVCLAHRLEKQSAFLNDHPEYILVGSDAEYIQENGDHLFDFLSVSYTHDEILSRLYQFCPFIHSSVMYRREAVLSAGGYSLSAHHFEDYFLWVNLVKRGKCCNLPEVLLKVRMNPASLTIDEKWRGKTFRKIKMKIIRKGTITENEEKALRKIIHKQQGLKIKEGSYHALCCKKFLADNHQPAKARWHAIKAISFKPFRFDNYAMLIVSYLPAKWIRWIRGKEVRNVNALK